MDFLNRHAINRLLSPVWRRLRMIVSRGVAQRSDDSKKLQVVQVSFLAGETADIERFQNYGFTARPLDGAEAMAVAVGGARGHLVAINVDDRRYRMKNLQQGEVAIYTDEGDFVHFKRGRIVQVNVGQDLVANVGNDVSINAGHDVQVNAANQVNVVSPTVNVTCTNATVQATTEITLDTPNVQVTQQLTVQGPIVGQGGMAISGGSGATVAGNMEITGGDVTADDISLKSHLTSGVTAGSDTSGGPVAS